MLNIPSFVWPLVAMFVNILWSALNMRTLSGLRDQIRLEFVSRVECVLSHKLCDDRHGELCRRMDCVEKLVILGAPRP